MSRWFLDISTAGRWTDKCDAKRRPLRSSLNKVPSGMATVQRREEASACIAAAGSGRHLFSPSGLICRSILTGRAIYPMSSSSGPSSLRVVNIRLWIPSAVHRASTIKYMYEISHLWSRAIRLVSALTSQPCHVRPIKPELLRRRRRPFVSPLASPRHNCKCSSSLRRASPLCVTLHTF